MSDTNIPEGSQDRAVETKYCETCGEVEPGRGLHPEYGKIDLCPNGGHEHNLFRSKEQMIDVHHEWALLETGRGIDYAV